MAATQWGQGAPLGSKRHSADVDFWLDRPPENLERLRLALNDFGYDLAELPGAVHSGPQNVSLNFSPVDLDVELITRFEVSRPFEDAYASSIAVQGVGPQLHRWRVLAYDDLIVSKTKAARPKDLLDIHELRRIRRERGEN